jgi:SAM-dependent methyltransferase
MDQIFHQAIEHVPALLFIWVTIYAVYWLLGIVNWPRFAKRDELLAKLGSVSLDALGGFRWNSLALISLLSLFLELLLIRWITSEIRIFAYFKSLVLIACFLGFGIGCYLTRRKIRIAYTLLPLLGMVFLIELPWDPSRRLITNLSGFIGWFSDVHIWTRAFFAGSPLWGVISAGIAITIVIPLFGLIAITFVPFGQLVGWYLENSPKGIRAYSVNVLASIAGIWLYTILCFYSTRPVSWFAFLGLGLVIYCWPLRPVRKAMLVSFALMLLLFGVGRYRTEWWGEQSWKGSLPALYNLQPGQSQTLWSPYQKLTLIPLKKGNETVRYVLNTNDSWYQQILDLTEAGVAKNPELYNPDEPLPYHQYNLPYKFYPRPQKVLIAGAGMGNDVAAALRNGAQSIVAVEIDPLIYAKGKELHFEHPYSSPRVEVHIDDARSFVQNCKEQFDLIVFSILDSHTTSSSYTNIRLDNYVYTLEAMQATKKLLKPDGLFVMSFSGERAWFAKRLRDVITQGFGKEPLLVQPRYSFFVLSPGDRVETALKTDADLRRFTETNVSSSELEDATPLTDDWPYLYQQYRGIPVIVWVLSLGLISVCWVTLKKLNKSSGGVQWHFFFLGAAFMLLEVQIISKTALLFGTTWLVNSIVITSLLLFILLSNLVVSLVPKFPRRFAYVGLFATLAVSYFIPTEAFFYESMLTRAAVSTLLYCSPVFFAGLIFISSFKEIGFRAEALGSNLLGALVGGLLDSLSYLVGMRALVLVSAGLYLFSLLAVSRVRGKEMVTVPPPAVIE